MDKLRKFLDVCMYEVGLFSLFLSSISVKQVFVWHIDHYKDISVVCRNPSHHSSLHSIILRANLIQVFLRSEDSLTLVQVLTVREKNLLQCAYMN